MTYRHAAAAVVLLAATTAAGLAQAPAARFPNAPRVGEGWTLAVECAMQQLPARHPATNACGQKAWDNQAPTLTLERGHPGEAVPGTFVRVGYPAASSAQTGNYGGAAPSRFSLTGPLPANTGWLYVGQYLRWSANWWHPANTGHKLFFPLQEGSPTKHFVAWVDNTSHTAGALLFKFGTQWGGAAGSPWVDQVWTDNHAGGRITPGEWHLTEMLLQPNAPGKADGVLTVWVDGAQVYKATNVPLFLPGKPVRWSGLWFDPIYAGNRDMPQHDQYLDLGPLQVMVR